MWTFISRIILRNRILLLILLALLTAFMGYKAKDAEVAYSFGDLLPRSDESNQLYQEYRKHFPKDGNIMVLGVGTDSLYQPEHFNAWYRLAEQIDTLEGVDSVFSETHVYGLRKASEGRHFELYPLLTGTVPDQDSLDRYIDKLRSFPFYRDLLYRKTDSSGASLMMIHIDREVMDSKKRMDLVHRIEAMGHGFEREHLELYVSGLPYIRTVTTDKVKKELRLFVALAILLTGGILFFFFRSMRVVLFSLLVVGIGVIWSLGTIALFEYKLSIVMALIPPLIIVIGIPNCVFLLNKYHNEFVEHGNKIKAITRIIHRIGNATFLTNTTTALGFATFIFTPSSMLQEFGVIASINIMGIFLFSLLIIPIVYSFLPEPKQRHTSHLRRPWIRRIVEGLTHLTLHYRPWVYGVTIVVLLISVFGITLMRTSGKIVDDLPKNDPVQQDLRFFQGHFNGVLPFEVFIDLGEKGKAQDLATLRKVSALQDSMEKKDPISRSLSMADGVKFAKQAFYNGDPARYSLISGQERTFIAPYLKGSDKGMAVRNFTDSSGRRTRITAQVADIGTEGMNELLAELGPEAKGIFDGEDEEVSFTGTSVLFFKGTEYLVKNLFISLSIAIAMIALIMAVLFNSVRMVVMSLIPNLIPLVITAALMGFFDISIKPSTVLVFSIAFGISVDDTIHFLAKYRQELKSRKRNFQDSVLNALRETGVSMFYTSVILFFGFAVFIASDFGGNQAIGILVSFTLLVAMLSNLVLLPSMLISFKKDPRESTLGDPVFEMIEREGREDDVNEDGKWEFEGSPETNDNTIKPGP